MSPRRATLILLTSALLLAAGCRRPSLEGRWSYGDLSGVESSDPQRYPAEVLKGTFDNTASTAGVTITGQGTVFDGSRETGEELDATVEGDSVEFWFFRDRQVRPGVTHSMRFEGQYESQTDSIDGRIVYRLSGELDTGSSGGSGGGENGPSQSSGTKQIDIEITGDMVLTRHN